MKIELFGFAQEKALEYNLTIEDLLLLDYICDMIASPTMQHIVDTGIPYVWLQHDRILADLPILNVSNRSLINYLNKLKDLGLLTVKTVHNDNLRGSKSYYAITEKCEALRYDQVKKIAVSQRPSEKNCSSDNISNNSLKQQELFNTKENIDKDKEYMSNKVQHFINNYNSICVSLPKCVRLTAKRSKGISNILKKFTEEEILEVFNNLENSDFCKGKNDRGWRASIDFILNEDKFVYTLEGRYNNKRTGRSAKSVETTSLKEGEVARVVSKEEREELRRMVERGELEEY